MKKLASLLTINGLVPTYGNNLSAVPLGCAADKN